jgi:hypothetical protein
VSAGPDSLPAMAQTAEPFREPREHRVREVAGTIYGTILVTALVAGLSEDESIDAWQLLVGVAATTIVFWVAHAYAEVLSKQIVADRTLTRHALAAEVSMIRAGVPAAVALGLAVVGVYSAETGAEIAIALGVVTLFILGLALGRREGATRTQILLGGVLNAMFGLVIVALKIFVH